MALTDLEVEAQEEAGAESQKARVFSVALHSRIRVSPVPGVI